MVEILCPHCEEEIELDDDASGEFACPYCEGEFEWNTSEDESTEEYYRPQFDLSAINPVAVAQVVLVGISMIGLWMCFGADPLYTVTLTDEEISQGLEFTYSADTMTMYNIYGINGNGKYTYWVDYLTNLNQECVQFTGEKCEGIDGMIEGMEAWDSAGNTYQVLMLIALISMILMLVLRTTSILYDQAVFDLPVGAAYLVELIGKGMYYFASITWFFAIAMHMILSPVASSPLGVGNGDLESSGYVGAVLFGLVYSLLGAAIHAGLSFVPFGE